MPGRSVPGAWEKPEVGREPLRSLSASVDINLMKFVVNLGIMASGGGR